MGDVVRTTSDPMLGRIRLAWWRERLEELGSGNGAPAEPRLRAVAQDLLPAGIEARELAALEDGWLSMLDPFPWTERTAEAVAARGGRLFRMGARILSRDHAAVGDAGRLWAVVDAARHCTDPASRTVLLELGLRIAPLFANQRFPRALRPLSMLAALAARDVECGEPFEGEGAPARALAMIRHRLTGRIPARRVQR